MKFFFCLKRFQRNFSFLSGSGYCSFILLLLLLSNWKLLEQNHHSCSSSLWLFSTSFWFFFFFVQPMKQKMFLFFHSPHTHTHKYDEHDDSEKRKQFFWVDFFSFRLDCHFSGLSILVLYSGFVIFFVPELIVISLTFSSMKSWTE